MGTCVICNRTASVLAQKCADGALCKECIKDLPSVFKPVLKQIPSYALAEYLQKWKTNKRILSKFEETSSYGLLHIDEMRGFFAICDSKDMKKGKLPSMCTDVFTVMHLNDFALTIETTEVTANSVKVAVTFTCKLKNPDITFKKVIKHATCFAERIDSERITYREPPDLTLFRNMFYQNIINTMEKYDRLHRQDYITPKAVAYTNARALFMVDKDYTIEEIKKQRNRLLKVYHPDENETDEDLTPYTRIINEAYKILKENIDES